MAGIRILVVGAGGREHALAWRLAQDAETAEVLVAPGNDGQRRSFRGLDVPEKDGAEIARVCRRERIDLVVIGPEAPLAAGVSDALAAAGVPVFGPSRAAARLESSKWFAKEVMRDAGVPTARGSRHASLAEAVRALDEMAAPWVVKADGLAGGKGVLVTASREEAMGFLRDCLTLGRFGEAGSAVVIEECLEGEEVSIMAVTDGRRHVTLPAARDYKRALDGDRGPNTGGMGAYAPAPLPEATRREIEERILSPTFERMAALGHPFGGALYAGLMLTARGPRVLEFNVRFGDPETEAVAPLIEGSFARLLMSAAAGSIEGDAIRASSGSAVAVALVAESYPGEARPGGRITGLDRIGGEELFVFHAGTRWQNGEWVVAGGRAAYVVARAKERETARERAYAAVAELGGVGWRCRGDVAREGAVLSERSGAPKDPGTTAGGRP